MMFMNQPKKTAMTIIANLKKDGKSGPMAPAPSQDGAEVDSDVAVKAALHDAFHAVKRDDVEGFQAAMMAFKDAIAQEDADADEEDSEPGVE